MCLLFNDNINRSLVRSKQRRNINLITQEIYVLAIGRAVTPSLLKREIRGSNLEQVKSDAVLPTARHRYDISSKGALLPGRAMT